MEERQQDDEFGFVRRDSDLLKRAMASEGAPTGSAELPPEGRPEAGARTSGGGEAVTRPPPARRPTPTVTPERPVGGGSIRSTSSSKVPGLLKRMTSVTISGQQASAPPREDDLPQTFQVKYLGNRDARGLWGIKHTRRPVDALVAAAKDMPPGIVLPLVKLVVSRDGVIVAPVSSAAATQRLHAIDTISYGVQDLVYTRVFSMIVVRESSAAASAAGRHPFECHAFVCDSRSSARRLTYALAAAFNEYSKVVKASGGSAAAAAVRKKFAIDLRTPEEIEAELNDSARPEVDSEA